MLEFCAVKDIINLGKYINDNNLVRIFIQNSSYILKELSIYGINLKYIYNKMQIKQFSGHKVVRTFIANLAYYSYLNIGLSITHQLIQNIQKRICI